MVHFYAHEKDSPRVSSLDTCLQRMEVSSKRNLPEMLFGWQTSRGMFIVHGLLAARNCPWIQGKHTIINKKNEFIDRDIVDGKPDDGKHFVVHTLLASPFCPWKQTSNPIINFNKRVVVHALMAAKICPWKLGFYLNDISQGKEIIPVSVVNTLDNEKPSHFEYTTEIKYPPSYSLKLPQSCQCKDGCTKSKKCACVGRNGGKFPFNKDGTIVSNESLIYECGPSCTCSASCRNRVSQKGIKFHLEIFKTKKRGWGVRSRDFIPSGSFICEYTGEALEDEEHDRRALNDEYFFDVDDFSKKDEDNKIDSVEGPSVSTIDAARYGNIGRYINHSCSPNLYASNVLFDHDNKSIPHIMLFATEDIPHLEELTLHYNYEWDSVKDSNGSIKKKNCYCGSKDCVGRMY